MIRQLFTRRSFLRSAPVAASVACLPSAVSADPETPMEKVSRLGRELSIALNDYADGGMHAEIYPSQKRAFPIGFVVTDLDIPPRIVLDRRIQDTMEALKAVFPERQVDVHSNFEPEASRGVLVFVTSEKEGLS